MTSESVRPGGMSRSARGVERGEPVELAYDRRETAAQTLLAKIRRHLDGFLVELLPTEIEKSSLGLQIKGRIR